MKNTQFTSLLILLFLFAFKTKAYSNSVTRDTLPPAVEASTDKVFAKVEIEADFPGGFERWLQFLQANLNSNIPIKRKAPVGTYTVFVQFVVDKEGKISDITPLTDHGFGMEEEVIRVLRRSPKWKPAIQDGRTVKAYRKQPITFVVQDDKPKKEKNS